MADLDPARPRPLIDADLARRLVAGQFPAWRDLPVRPVARGGWDNRTFHLGESMLIRLPSAGRYAAQVEKEQAWLPRLALHLPLSIPEPLAMGEPAEGYRWRWSVYRWLEGDTAEAGVIADPVAFGAALGDFLAALQRIEAAGGPGPGDHNFHRGGALATYDGETRRAIATLGTRIDGPAAEALWEAALDAAWTGPPVWLHGDVSAGNLLVSAGRLSGVIDFGSSAVGDPACDLAIAWTFLDGAARAAFRERLALDDATWMRGRGWTLWKALIVLAAAPGVNPAGADQCERIIASLLAEARPALETASKTGDFQ